MRILFNFNMIALVHISYDCAFRWDARWPHKHPNMMFKDGTAEEIGNECRYSSLRIIKDYSISQYFKIMII